MMTTMRSFIKTHPVLTYYVLTFTLSWGTILMVIGPDGILGRREVSEALLPILYAAMLVGPSVAGIVMTGLVDGRAGFRELLSRLLRWRAGARWYLAALLTAPLSLATVLLPLSLFSPDFLPAIITSSDKSSLVVTGIVVGLLVGCFEELGWTGFVLPRLRLRYSMFASALLMGVLWGLWHFVVFCESDTFSGIFPLTLLLARLFAWLPPYRMLMVWVYENTGSLLVAMLMHVSLVANNVFIFMPAVTGSGLLVYLVIWGGTLWLITAGVASIQSRQAALQPLQRQIA